MIRAAGEFRLDLEGNLYEFLLALPRPTRNAIQNRLYLIFRHDPIIADSRPRQHELTNTDRPLPNIA